MPYQSFEPGAGSSRSQDKLAAIRLPDLAGKAVLDLGCNEGFFCFAALERGAASVTGLDRNPAFVEAARARAAALGLPEERARFLLRSWDELPPGRFDVVLLMSALHYAADQEALLDRIADRLAPGGLLILEGGMTEGPEPWTPVERGPKGRRTTVLYPSRAKLNQALGRRFAVRPMGPSVPQAGDPVPRWVHHCTRLMPVVLALAGKGGAGKSTLALLMGRKGVPRVASDEMVTALARRDDALGRLVAPHVTRGQLGRSYGALVAAGLSEPLAREAMDRLGAALAGEDVAVFEGALLVHAPFLEALRQECERRGVVLWLARRPQAPAPPPAPAG